MTKRFCMWMLAVAVLAAAHNAWAEEGETVFKSLGCTACHRQEGASKVNPSLAEIAQAYQGKEAQLLSYLKGEAQPIIRPEKAGMMKSKIEKTKALSDADRQALADYLLQQK